MDGRAVGGVVLVAGLLGSSAQAAIVISSDPTLNMTCSKKQVCSPDGENPVLNVGQLEQMLGTGSVRVTTTGSVEATDLQIESSLTWASSNVLTLDAAGSIRVDRSVSVTGTSGIVMNDGGPANLTVGPDGSISFWDPASTLTINRKNYTLVSDLPTLAADIAATPKGYFALAANYDASLDGTYGKSPIIKPFRGTFEGLGNAISNFSFACGGRCKLNGGYALFKTITGTVENLRLLNIDLEGNNAQAGAGGLAAELSGTARGLQVTGRIAGFQYAGGLANEVRAGVIEQSSSSVAITLGLTNLNVAAGGLVSNCVSDGTNPSTILRSYAMGSVDVGGGGVSKGATAGGLVAVAGSGCNVDQSFATGPIKLTAGALGGGLVGNGLDPGHAGPIITNSYATGSVTGDAMGRAMSLGGLEGANGGGASSSYGIGAVALTNGSDNGVAGLIGLDSTTPDQTASDYWDTTTSGQAQCIGLELGSNDASGCKGLTSNKLKSGLPRGFDSSIWTIDLTGAINNGFPYLIGNPPPQ
jgi:hypothetical protein